MEKPIDLVVLDAKDNILNTINESKLPLSILSMILHEISNLVDMNLKQQVDNLKKQQQVKENTEVDKQ